MKDNRGVSLVELLIAISIAAIVAGSLGYLLVTSLNMYGNEISDVSMQKEVGTAYNIIESYIKEAQYFAVGNYKNGVVSGSGDLSTLDSYVPLENKTRFLVLGKITDKFDAAAEKYVSYSFSGVIIVADENIPEDVYTGGEPVDGRLYLQVIQETTDPALNLTNYDAIESQIVEMMKPENKNKYLLATNVQNFFVVPENMAPGGALNLMPGTTSTPEEGYNAGYSIWESTLDETDPVTGNPVAASKYYYNNNISLKVNLTVASRGATKIEQKNISESVMLRNYLTKDIIINDKKYKEYNSTAH